MTEQNPAAEPDDTEGHRARPAVDDSASRGDDIRGDDTEGHKIMLSVDDDTKDDDTEGHSKRP